MTIAAGFCFEDGILLCSDSEGTLGASLKIHQQKIFFQRTTEASIACVIAGSVSHARMAVQEIFQIIKKSDDQTYETIQRIIKEKILEVYTKQIFSHPQAPYNQAPSFDLIFGVWTKDGGFKLLSTSETAVVELDEGFECKGSGEVLARYLISRSGQSYFGRLEPVILLAVIVLNNVRTYVPGCGGNTHLFVIDANGWLSYVAPYFVREIEAFAGKMENEAFRVLRASSNYTLADKELENELKEFCLKMKLLRCKLREKELQPIARYLVPMGEYGF